MRFRIRAVILIVVIAGIAGIVGLAVSGNSPTPKLTTPAPTCQPDPSAAINATPAGGTWNGGGDCYTTDGIKVTTSNIVITDATFSDPLVAKLPHAEGGIPPIVTLWQTKDDTLSDLSIQGANPTGAYHAKLVNQDGVKLVETSGTTITGTTVYGTFGDCLEVFAQPPKYVTPNTDLTINGLSANECGRMLISPSDVNGMTMTNFHGGDSGYAGIDFESDLNLGAGNVTISDSTWSGTILEEEMTGPITFTNDSTYRLNIEAHHTAFPLVFQGGTLTIPSKSDPGGISIANAGAVTFTHYTFARNPAVPGSLKAPLWNVSPTGHLTITDSKLSAPLGASGPNVVLSGNSGG
jgi:hypothetical protein